MAWSWVSALVPPPPSPWPRLASCSRCVTGSKGRYGLIKGLVRREWQEDHCTGYAVAETFSTHETLVRGGDCHNLLILLRCRTYCVVSLFNHVVGLSICLRAFLAACLIVRLCAGGQAEGHCWHSHLQGKKRWRLDACSPSPAVLTWVDHMPINRLWSMVWLVLLIARGHPVGALCTCSMLLFLASLAIIFPSQLVYRV